MIRNLKLLCGVALTVWSYTLGYAQCSEPTGLTVSAITSSTAQTTWTSSGPLFDLQLINVTDADTTFTNGVSATSFALSGLDPETDYEVAVRTDCGPFSTPQFSVWTSLTSFTTTPSCPSISGLSLDLVSADSATVSWTQGYSEALWDLELISGTDTLTYTPTYNDVTTNTYTLTGLSELTDYTLIVRADCGGLDGSSIWSNELEFSTIAYCQQPTDLISGAISNASIELFWLSNDNETSWDIEVVNITNSETSDGSVDYTSSDTTYTVTGLNSESDYEIYIRANCGVVDGNSIWTGPISITTLCDPVAAPYELTFTSWPPACVDLTGGSDNFEWYTNGSDSVAEADFWDDNNVDYYMTLPIITLTQSGILSFEWSHDYSSSYPFDGLEVFVSGDNGSTWNSVWSKVGEALDSDDGASSTSPGSFVSESILLDYTTYGPNVMVRFIAHSDYGPNLYIKSVDVSELPACNTPYYVTIDSVSTNDADFSFTIAGSGATSYEIELIEAGDTLTGVATSTASGTPFTILGLNSATDYQVYIRTMCGSDSTDWIGPYSFTTECAPESEYEMDFEGLSSSDVPVCWNFIDESSSWTDFYISTWAGDAYAGSNSVYIYNSSSTGADVNQFLVAPEFSTVSTATHRARFWAKGGNDLVIGTMSDPSDYGTFTAFDTLILSNIYTQYIVEFDDYVGSDSYVALKNMAANSYRSIYVDNFEWQEIPSCFPPLVVSIDTVTTTSVTATIDSTGTYGDVWYIEYVDASGNNPIVYDTVNTLTFTTTGLLASTSYEMNVSSFCTDVESEVLTENFQTICTPESINYMETFVSSEPACYDFTGGNTSFEHYTNNGNTAVVADFWSDSDGTYHMTTPEIEMDSAARLEFNWSYAYSSSWSDKLEIFISNDGATWNSVWLGEGSSLNSNDGGGYTSPGSYAEAIVPIDASYIGSDIQFKFIGTSDYGPNLYIDEIRVEYLPECEMPVSLSLDSVADVFAMVDWGVVSLDTAWAIELVNVSNGDTVTGIATDTAYAHPYTFNGLQESGIYSVYLTSLCDTGNVWLGPLNFVTQWSNDIGVSSIVSPAQAGCNLNDSVQIEVEITNFAAQAQSGFPIELSWDDSIYVNVGTFLDTLQPGQSANFVLDGYYDFSTAIDSAFWVQTSLVGDTVNGNNSLGSTVTNLGDMLINVQINLGDYPTEVAWALVDTVNNIVVDSMPNFTYSDWNTTFNHEVCVFAGGNYVFNAWDTFDDGWNGGTYSITRCGGIILANNDGNEVTNGLGGISGWDLEATESFNVEACPDNDLAVMSIDGLESGCGLGLETGTVTIMNFGNLDVANNDAMAQYQFNNSGLWVDFWDFDTGLGSQEDTIFTMPAVDMSVTGMYTIDVRIVFALDTDTTTNYLSAEVTSVPTLVSDTADFNSGNGGWTSHIISGVNNSWEYGTPTTAVAGSGNDQEVWATNLSGNASLNEESYLLSPCYDFSSYSGTDVEVVFDFVRTDFNHYFALQYELNGSGNWNYIYSPTSNTTDWTTKTVLVGVGGESDVKFRWYFDSSWSGSIEGFAFDNWMVFEHVPYTDATASYINVNGSLVQGFHPDTMSYEVELPYGSSLPYVSAGFNAPIVDNIDVDQVTTLPGAATVTITAENTSYVNVYTVNFTEAAPSADASLSNLAVSGPSIPGFDTDTLSYTMYMNCGITPNIVATVHDPNATVVVTTASNPGIATAVVTAQDGVTTQTYYVNLLCFILSDDADLTDLNVGGSTVVGFDANTLVYNVELPYGTSAAPAIGFITSDAGATVVINPTTFPGTTTVTVTAENGTTVQTYIINYTIAPNSDASLLDLAINGGTISGFSATTYVYSVQLAYGEALPPVTVVATDPNANIDIDNATAIPGTTIITVTAEDGTTIAIYYIHWSESPASNDASLDSLYTDAGLFCLASPAAELEVNGNSYVLTVGQNFTSLVNLTIVKTDPTATYALSGSATVAPYGTINILVTAQDGVTTETYTVLVQAENCNIGLDETVLGQISVSPNPSNGMFSITIPSELNSYTMAVVDQLGKVVYQEHVNEEVLTKDVDLSALPSGIYNLRIQTANDYIVKRISIIK